MRRRKFKRTLMWNPMWGIKPPARAEWDVLAADGSVVGFVEYTRLLAFVGRDAQPVPCYRVVNTAYAGPSPREDDLGFARERPKYVEFSRLRHVLQALDQLEW